MPSWLCLWALGLVGSCGALGQQLVPGAATPPQVINQPIPGLQPGLAQPTLGQTVLGQPGSIQQPGAIPFAPATPTASTTPLVVDTANANKFYTISASLREGYDDNVFTSRYNKIASTVTELSPSVLVNLPLQDSSFDARYTFGFDYYADRPGNKVDQTHEVVVHYTHTFNSRFNLDASEDFGYFKEPDLLGGVGDPFFSGEYFSNVAVGSLTAQWTHLLGTVTSFSNVALIYQDSGVSIYQNSDESTLSHDFRFAVYPKFDLTAGGILDKIDYFSGIRGYTSYTLDGGIDWQALPTLSLSVRAGIELTETVGASSQTSPYAAATVNWVLGKRSSLQVSYTHSVEPTDEFNAEGEEADRISLSLTYDLSSRITVQAAAIATYADYTSELLAGGASSFTEFDSGLSLSGTYRLTGNFSFEAGYNLSDISSQASSRDYVRNQVYLGVRGTY